MNWICNKDFNFNKGQFGTKTQLPKHYLVYTQSVANFIKQNMIVFKFSQTYQKNSKDS